MTPRWIVWCGDGSSFTDLDGPPETAPRRGVQVVAAISADHGRVLWHGKDYYWWDVDHGEWLCGDFAGLLDYLMLPGATKIVLQGRSLTPAGFRRIYEMANADPRLPPRSSYDALEDYRV